MDLTSHNNASENTDASTNKDYNPSECILNQPKANGTLPHHSTGEAPPPLSDRLQDTDNSDESLTDSSSTSDVSRLLPAHWQQKDETSSSEAPVCTPPQPTCPSLPPSRSSTSNRHHHQSTNHKRLSSTKSHASFKTDAAQIKEVAGDGECMACGVGVTGCCEASDGCCCCVEAAGEAACTEEACQAALDCCCSSDCMEICLECCSICFPS